MTLAYWIDTRNSKIKEKAWTNTWKGITEVLEKDRRKAENWSNESWKAELGWSWKLVYWRPSSKIGARRLWAEAHPAWSMKLVREGSLLNRYNKNLQAKEFLLAHTFGLSLIKNPQTHNKTGLVTMQKTSLKKCSPLLTPGGLKEEGQLYSLACGNKITNYSSCLYVIQELNDSNISSGPSMGS